MATGKAWRKGTRDLGPSHLKLVRTYNARTPRQIQIEGLGNFSATNTTVYERTDGEVFIFFRRGDVQSDVGPDSGDPQRSRRPAAKGRKKA
jgi:hypothetical protein